MLNDLHRDVLTEVINMGVGQGAKSLNTMLSTHVILSVPEIKLLNKETIHEELSYLKHSSLAIVLLRFSGSIPGQAALLFPPESAMNLVRLLVPEEEQEEDSDLDSMRSEALTEIGNIVLNNVMGNFSNFFHLSMEYSLPDFLFEADINDFLESGALDEGYTIILARTHFDVRKHSIAGDIMLFFGISSLENMIQLIEQAIKDQTNR